MKRQREDPRAGFSASPAKLRVGQTLHLFDASSDPSGVGIAWRAWDFGDGETATGSYPTHRYAAGGDYTVKLTLATFDGRLASISQEIKVTPPGPNATVSALLAPPPTVGRRERHPARQGANDD